MKGLACGAGLLFALACRPEPTVLLYHAVGCETGDPLDVPLAEFVAQLEAAQGAGFTFVRLTDLLEGRAVERPGATPIALTFDDGARCLYSAAYPELLARHIPFTLFVPSQWMAGPHLQEVGRRTHWLSLSGDELQRMAGSGLLEVGSHSATHARLPALDTEQARAEIAGSRRQLQALTGQPIELFAYPYGSFSGRELRLVREAGYRAAAAVSAGTGGRFAFHRRSIHAGTSRQAFLRALEPHWRWPLLGHE